MRKHHGFILNNELEDKKMPYGIDYFLNVRLHFYEYHELSKMFYQQDNLDEESYIEYKILTQYEEFDSIALNYLMKQIKIDSDSCFYNLSFEQLKELKKELDNHLESLEF